jgi:DNA polymerase I-like protein with 3'-5' exonuclease and polymerase domains
LPAMISNEERKKAKAVNFGFLYGMGWGTFIETAWIKYGLRVTEQEARAFRKSFFDQFPELPLWHERQKALARKYKRVQSPMGRIRHLPDIDSPDSAVSSQAERQAINSPVQAVASDMTLLSMVRLQRRFRKMGLDCHALGTIHDAINLECRTELLPIALPIIKDTMERLPLRKMFGLHLNVPIKADVSVGKYWGNARKLNDEEVRNYTYGGIGGEDEYGSKHHKAG